MLLSSSSLWAQAAEDELPPPPPEPPAADLPPPPPPSEPPAAELPPSPETLPPAVESPPASVVRPEGEQVRDWYGWQLLLNDFVALGALGGAAAAGVKDGAAIAVIVPVAIVYDLGGPTIHWLHERKKIAALSFGVRVGVPFVGVVMGAAVAGCDKEQSSAANSCRSRGAGYGALFGFAAATAIDASLLAWDAPRGKPGKVAAFRWAPFVAPGEGGAALGVVGTF